MMRLSLLTLTLAICLVGVKQARSTEKPAPVPPDIPVLMAIVVDCSGSYEDSPKPDPLFFDRCIDMIAIRGGHLAFMLIRDSSFKPMIRESFSIDTVSPIGRLLSEQILIRRHNDSTRLAFESKKNSFIARVMSEMNSTTSTQQTDIYGAVARVSILMNEPVWTDHYRLVCFFTDSKNTVKYPVTAQPDARVFVVGSTQAKADSVFDSPILFENSIGLLEFLSKQLTLVDESSPNRLINRNSR
ncbi:MAG: hypothetical protein JSV52_07925 [Candidatus Zixiibacteriota bacterium]|nr:MAG: hypothetical protein JSV52_07925 [candidate division Zixibacteria bacterium]